MTTEADVGLTLKPARPHGPTGRPQQPSIDAAIASLCARSVVMIKDIQVLSVNAIASGGVYNRYCVPILLTSIFQNNVGGLRWPAELQQLHVDRLFHSTVLKYQRNDFMIAYGRRQRFIERLSLGEMYVKFTA